MLCELSPRLLVAQLVPPTTGLEVIVLPPLFLPRAVSMMRGFCCCFFVFVIVSVTRFRARAKRARIRAAREARLKEINEQVRLCYVCDALGGSPVGVVGYWAYVLHVGVYPLFCLGWVYILTPGTAAK